MLMDGYQFHHTRRLRQPERREEVKRKEGGGMGGWKEVVAKEEHKAEDELSVEAEEGRIKRRKETVNLYLRRGKKSVFVSFCAAFK